MSNKSPSFQLYANDFFVDTITWELDELGLYSRLLFIEWTNGPLENNEKKLAKIAGTSVKKFNYLFKIVSTKFILNDDGKLINLRLEKTREKQRLFIENQSLKGKKSAKKRSTTVESTDEPRLEPRSQPKVNPSSSNIKEKKKEKKTPLPKDFKISDRVKVWAIEKGFNRLEEHLESFILKCQAREYSYVDWDSAFMVAIRENWAKLENSTAKLVAKPARLPTKEEELADFNKRWDREHAANLTT